MTEAVNRPPMSFTMEAAGFVRLSWAPGLQITGDMASEAVHGLAVVCEGRRMPMLVDMTGTAVLTRPARVVFTEKSSASRIALLGKSAVDRVIANFYLGVSGTPVPTRFFTSEPLAIAWLTNPGDAREP
ncbi:MAG: STAS/SEC14 domain-containing protein [Lapillicoccus sp.]